MKFTLLFLVSLVAASTAIEVYDKSNEVAEKSFELGEEYGKVYEESDEVVEDSAEDNEEESFGEEEDLEAKETNQKSPKQYAVLVAGSDGWYNYRHQADICHAYQILIKRGIPASNIIVMMKDDVAHDSQNPKPGTLINRPNGPDVYKGVKIDYKGSAVTPQNFLNVLMGKKNELRRIGTGRVLESGPKDNVFIYFSDHGGTGVLCFPAEDLSAKDFVDTLNKLTKQKKYGQLLLYIEACESGSMFDNLLPENTRILASTAAAYDEPSLAHYCDLDNWPCLGDFYSINWLEHMDKKISNNEDLFDHFQTIRTLTTGSHVNLYGDYRIGLHNTNQFIGPRNIKSANRHSDSVDEKYATSVSSRDTALYWLKRMVKRGENSITKMRYANMISEIEKARQLVDEAVNKVVMSVSMNDKNLQSRIEENHWKLSANMLECHQNMYRLFSKKCVNMFKNPYVLKHLYKFANICHLGPLHEERAISAINSCSHETLRINNAL